MLALSRIQTAIVVALVTVSGTCFGITLTTTGGQQVEVEAAQVLSAYGDAIQKLKDQPFVFDSSKPLPNGDMVFFGIQYKFNGETYGIDASSDETYICHHLGFKGFNWYNSSYAREEQSSDQSVRIVNDEVTARHAPTSAAGYERLVNVHCTAQE